MESGLKPPRALSFEGNVAENWRRWIQHFRLFLNATGRDKKSEEIQCSTLLAVAGEDAMEVYNTFVFAEGEENKIETLIKTFELYCTPKKNVTFERHVFNTRNQEPNESIDSYVTELRKLAKSCEFAQLHNSLIKDRIVCGIHSAEVKARLLREEDLTLDKALNICRTAELSKTQLQNLVDGKRAGEINIIHKKNGGTVHQHGREYKDRGEASYEYESRSSRTEKYDCKNCGLKHGPMQCGAKGKQCHKCQKFNHYARMCLSGGKRNPNKINAIKEVDTSDSEEEFFIETIGQGDKTPAEAIFKTGNGE